MFAFMLSKIEFEPFERYLHDLGYHVDTVNDAGFENTIENYLWQGSSVRSVLKQIRDDFMAAKSREESPEPSPASSARHDEGGSPPGENKPRVKSTRFSGRITTKLFDKVEDEVCVDENSQQVVRSISTESSDSEGSKKIYLPGKGESSFRRRKSSNGVIAEVSGQRLSGRFDLVPSTLPANPSMASLKKPDEESDPARYSDLSEDDLDPSIKNTPVDVEKPAPNDGSIFGTFKNMVKRKSGATKEFLASAKEATKEAGNRTSDAASANQAIMKEKMKLLQHVTTSNRRSEEELHQEIVDVSEVCYLEILYFLQSFTDDYHYSNMTDTPCYFCSIGTSENLH
jgi:hypothetical protein